MLHSTHLMTILSIRKFLNSFTFQTLRTFSSKVSKRNASCLVKIFETFDRFPHCSFVILMGGIRLTIKEFL